jgi:small subunit ribosomal protein S1
MEQANFAKLLDESLSTLDFQIGTIITGVIVDLKSDWVTVHVGLKSEPVLARSEFLADESDKELEIGDEVKVTLEAVEDGYGETRISREKARKISTWKNLEHALETGEFVTGKILNRVKGGFAVEVDVVKAFLPGSLVDTRPLKEAPNIENTVQDFKVIKLDYKRNNVVLSRKAVLEEANSAEKLELLKNLEEGQIVKGIVKNITDYGAFIDLGGLDGLLHITDISWSRVINPADSLNLGEEIEVKVLSFDKEKLRVSLGLKQIQNDPWEQIDSKYSSGGIYEAVVSKATIICNIANHCLINTA